jgi:hypothetical protein
MLGFRPMQRTNCRSALARDCGVSGTIAVSGRMLRGQARSYSEACYKQKSPVGAGIVGDANVAIRQICQATTHPPDKR